MVSQNEITLIVINDPHNSYHGISTRMKVISLSNLTLFNLNQICYSEFNYTLFYQKLGIRSIKVITFVITHCALKSLCHHTKRAWFMPLLRMFHFWFALTSHTYKLLNNFRLNMRKKVYIEKSGWMHYAKYVALYKNCIMYLIFKFSLSFFFLLPNPFVR